VHFTVTPYHDEITRVLEPLTAPADVRWNVIRKLKEAGIRVHVNVAPVVPLLSEHLIERWVEILSEIAPAEYFVDPMQPYQESFSAFAQACTKIEGLDWTQVRDTMLDKDKYLEWKQQYRNRWDLARKKLEYKCPDTLPIWCDHEFGTWVDMRTNKAMNNAKYGDEE
jgi:DNA repair photolyase